MQSGKICSCWINHLLDTFLYLLLNPKFSVMKRLSTFALVAFVLFFTSSCEQIKDAADITFETTFDETFVVDIQVATEPDGSAVFTESATIDLNDGDVKDYVDKLKNIVIKKVQLQVLSSNSAPNAEVSGTIDLGGGFYLAIPPTNIQNTFDTGTIIDLSDNAGAFNYLKDQLLNQKMITYSLNGMVSEVPVVAEFKLIYRLDVTANPL